MLFSETVLSGAYVIEPERHADERGFFARTFCECEFRAQGLNTEIVQCSISFNARRNTLRGMHFQAPPFAEVKLIRCTSGAIFDVIIDLRRSSATFLRHVAVTLSAENRTMLYVPEGFAHGFQTMEDNTEVFYQMSQFYSADHSRCIRWNDRAFGIEWPSLPGGRIMSERDRDCPDFSVEDCPVFDRGSGG